MQNTFGVHTKKYLEINKSMGLGQGYTISTYVRKHCKVGYAGRYAKDYGGRIYMDLLSHPDKVFRFTSVRGSYAWYPKEMLRGENKKKYLLALSLNKLNPELTCNSILKACNRKKRNK